MVEQLRAKAGDDAIPVTIGDMATGATMELDQEGRRRRGQPLQIGRDLTQDGGGSAESTGQWRSISMLRCRPCWIAQRTSGASVTP
jgi:hypothetical protein